MKKRERNIDKIRRLEKELAEQRERRRNADLEIMRMHRVVDHARNEAGEQVRELSVAVDGIIIALAMRCGANVGEGVWEIGLDRFSPTQLCDRYRVAPYKAGDRVVYRVEEASRHDNQ